jgi:hypothetical protein
VRPAPANKLSAEERAEVLALCHESPYASLPPGQIVPRLADEGRYIASESSFYRILHEAEEQQHRGRARAPRPPAEPAFRGFGHMSGQAGVGMQGLSRGYCLEAGRKLEKWWAHDYTI